MLDRNVHVLWCVWYRGHVHDIWVLPFECDEHKRACFLPSWSMHISPNEGRAQLIVYIGSAVGHRCDLDCSPNNHTRDSSSASI